MNAARRKPITKHHGSSKKEPLVISSDPEDVSSASEPQNNSIPHFEISMKSKNEDSLNPSCIDFNSTSLSLPKEHKGTSLTEKLNFTYKEVLVKNPDFTNKKKLAKDQSTLDNFVVDFQESKYLKTNKLISNKYRQLTIFDCKKRQKKQGKK